MKEDICCHIGAGSGIFLPHISSPVRARSNRHRPEPERRTCRPPAGGGKQDTRWALGHTKRMAELPSNYKHGGDSFIHQLETKPTQTDSHSPSKMCVRGRGDAGEQATFHRRSGDTHTEDVQAHRPFNALLVGEVILGELMNRCGENTHTDWVEWDRADGCLGEGFGGGLGRLVGVRSLV